MKDLKKRASGGGSRGVSPLKRGGVEGGLPPQKKIWLKSSTNKENKIILKFLFYVKYYYFCDT